MKIFMVFTKDEYIFFLFYSLHANARFWRQTKQERHGVDVQSFKHVKRWRDKKRKKNPKIKVILVPKCFLHSD